MSASEENRPTASIAEDSEESGDETKKSEESKKSEVNPLLAEEAKLKAKYPNVGRPMAGHSGFLQKRLQKGQKYFDSGDYQMAKQRGPAALLRGGGLPMRPPPSTGDAIPTPESMPARKSSLVQSSQSTTLS